DSADAGLEPVADGSIGAGRVVRHRCPAGTGAGETGVAGRARVPVVAQRTVRCRASGAGARLADIAERAGIAVVAGAAVGAGNAGAGAGLAGVGRGARVPVVTRRGVVRVNAARRVAAVVGARVAVVARERGAGHAGEILALLGAVADIGVDAVGGGAARRRAARAVDADVRRGDEVQAEDHIRQLAQAGDVEQRQRADELPAGEVARLDTGAVERRPAIVGLEHGPEDVAGVEDRAGRAAGGQGEGARRVPEEVGVVRRAGDAVHPRIRREGDLHGDLELHSPSAVRAGPVVDGRSVAHGRGWGGRVGERRVVVRPGERSLAVRVLATPRHARRVGIVDVVVQIAAEVSAGAPAVAVEGAAAVARGGDAEGAEARERYGRQDDGVDRDADPGFLVDVACSDVE